MTLAFARFAHLISRLSGTSWAFCLALATVLAWAVTGPMFGYSEGWQMVINTGTTIVTFLMVFAIQSSQNRDTAALQAKMDEMIRVTEPANNDLIGSESPENTVRRHGV